MVASVGVSIVLVFVLAARIYTEAQDFDTKNDDLCGICSCNPEVTVVDCSRRGLTEIPGGRHDNVQRLNMSDNEISEFPQNLERFPNLKIFDLSGNHLSSIPRNALYNMTDLDILNLSRNMFSRWIDINPNSVLYPAVNLRVLDLSQNSFTTLANLENNELLLSSSLEALILESCAITSIHGKSPISGLTSIKTLKLAHNPLRRIQNLVSPSLKSLDISNCELSYIHPNSFSYLPSLMYLQMAHNYRLVMSSTSDTLTSESLRYIDLSYCNVVEASLGGFPNLRKAIMTHNMVRFLPSVGFINNTKLENLDLSYNSIGSINANSFQGLVSLKHLDLSWNEISFVPENTFLETPALTKINLSRNYLTRVGHLKSLSLNILDMSQCEVSSIGKDSLEGLQSLIDLNLSRNLISNIPDSLSSNTLQYLDLNFNRIGFVNNFTFFMLPRLTSLSVVGNRFTTIWNKAVFQSNPYLEKLDLSDNMWRCDCADSNMYDFYEYLTLEPSKKEESYNLYCNSPINLNGITWFEACYVTWFPGENQIAANNLIWFFLIIIICMSLVFLVVSCIRRSMQRRLEAIQAERERQVEEARDRLRQLRMRHEQEALCNAPDPRDLISPPSYDEALSMPKLNTSSHSLNETGSGKARRKRGRRKTKSSSDLLDETNRNGELPIVEDFELTETNGRRQPRRPRHARRYGSHEIAELDNSPGARRRRMSEYRVEDDVAIEIEDEVSTPLRSRRRRNSIDDDDPRESDF